jgi:hypothetical protein
MDGLDGISFAFYLIGSGFKITSSYSSDESNESLILCSFNRVPSLSFLFPPNPAVYTVGRGGYDLRK